MGKRDRGAPPPPPAAPARPFNDAFAKLAERASPSPPHGGGAAAPASPSPPHGGGAAAPASPSPPRSGGEGWNEGAPASPGPARAIVRLERKGRGGKEATVVEKLGLPPRTLEAWALEAKRALGCGGAVEGDALVLQGDQRERAVRWLEGKGVRKVVRG
jgi:translation initiation factor 1